MWGILATALPGRERTRGDVTVTTRKRRSVDGDATLAGAVGQQVGIETVRAQAHARRVLASEAFSKAHSLRRLLEYVVEETLAGRADSLKEYAIGVEVFGRGQDFDPRADTIVRVQARRLRAKLQQYYAVEGYADGLAIDVPTGSYLPRFRETRGAAVAGAESGPPRTPAAAPEMTEWTWARELDEPRPPVGSVPRTAALPVPRTTLIGRDAEVAALVDALRGGACRVLTLSGPGGSGKTQLALQVAADVGAAFPGGVFFVGLGSLTDAADVGPTLAQALGLSRIERGSVAEALCAYVRATVRARTLLVLDNFEQLLAAAPLLVALVESTPALTLLVTSRAVLRISGERCFPVPPLPVPDVARLPVLEALGRNPAIALFVRQAAARQPAFALTADNAATLAAICVRLDGLPLAIELAAARVRILAPAQILARLERRLTLLVDGGRDLPVRQQTLRQAIDWSHELLSDAERRLFRRLAVFAGSWTLEGAEAVCNPRQDAGLSVLDGLSSLVDKSLIQPIDTLPVDTVPVGSATLHAAPSEPRFAMLETVREYALEQLDASGEHPVTRRAHAAYCLVLAEEGLGPIPQAQRDEWLARCQREHDNYRAAFDHLIATHDTEWALRLALALADYWDRHDHRLEGYARFHALLRLPGLAARTRARATAIAHASLLSPVLEATHAEQEALSIYRELGDLRGVVGQLNNLGVNYRFLGDYALARACLEESVGICRQLGDRTAVATALSNLADVRRRQGHHADARAALDEAHALFGQAGHTIGQAWSLNHLGDVARSAGDLDEARGHYQCGAELFRASGDAMGEARSAIDLGHLACEEGDVASAHALFGAALDTFERASQRLGVAIALEAFACAALVEGHRDRALTLAGAAAAVRRAGGAVSPGALGQGTRVERRVAELWALDDVDAVERRTAGAALPLERAVALARQGASRPPDYW
jgi:predicted ATPase